MRGSEYIYGKHALTEAILNRPECISKVFLGDKVEESFTSLLNKSGVPISQLKSGPPKSFLNGTAHQGVIGVLNVEKLMISLKDFLQKVNMNEKPSIVLLDELEDPHNVGAIIRSATAFGMSGVIIPERRQAQITGSVVKASAGMVFRIPIITVVNVNDTLRTLKEKGFWIYGLTLEGKLPKSENFTEASVFVIGNESRGIREKTLEECDIKISIPMDSKCESLNAAAAAAVIMYEFARGR